MPGLAVNEICTYHDRCDLERRFMYLLAIKDGLLTRYVGPYSSTKEVSNDLQRVLSSCSSRASWQIHLLEDPRQISFSEKFADRATVFDLKAS